MSTKRAEELKDNSGYTLGTAEYFRKINETTVFHYLQKKKAVIIINL
ncbi:MAG: hypothetical protein LKJ75_12300 [Clostridia bacterium]|jgi:hypothetical protein|nr:hypothetical protein [Clostridia bacterium]MCI2015969.1 hypothetical protein [Clostridia bacterium]